MWCYKLRMTIYLQIIGMTKNSRPSLMVSFAYVGQTYTFIHQHGTRFVFIRAPNIEMFEAFKPK